MSKLMFKAVVAMGTRPEVVKLAPVVKALQGHPACDVRVLVTAQHREMLDQMMSHFGLRADRDLDLMQPGQSLEALTARIVTAAGDALRELDPNLLVVQGDTTTTFATALAAFYQGIPVAHVEAGLRSGDLRSPFPEEMNRRVTSQLASLHFAPTPAAARRLIGEGFQPDRVRMVGNTVVDALLAQLDSSGAPPVELTDPPAVGPLVLVTLHRRENHGAPHRRIAEAVVEVLERRPDAWALLPLHPNPAVRGPLSPLVEHPRVRVTAPLDYPVFCRALAEASLAISDSGGVQEEAPTVGTPVLVARENTERPEAVEAGAAVLVGSDFHRIVSEADRWLSATGKLELVNPFGDGHAGQRIADALLSFCTEL